MNAASSGLSGHSYLSGSTTSVLIWPLSILPPTYTLFHIAKYNVINGARMRIFDSPDAAWMSGFYGGVTGVAYHAGWLTPNVDCCGYNWVLSTDQNGLYRANGVQKSTSAGGSSSNQLGINSSGNGFAQPSDWAVAAAIVFNRTLSTAEITTMESWLSQLFFNDATGRWLGDRFIWVAYQLSCSWPGGRRPSGGCEWNICMLGVSHTQTDCIGCCLHRMKGCVGGTAGLALIIPHSPVSKFDLRS